MQINRNKIQVYGGKGLELMKPAHEPVFSRPRSRASQKNAPGKLPIRVFQQLGGRGYDDPVPGDGIKTTPSGDITT